MSSEVGTVSTMLSPEHSLGGIFSGRCIWAKYLMESGVWWIMWAMIHLPFWYLHKYRVPKRLVFEALGAFVR